MKTYTHGGDIYSYKTKPIDFSSNINPLGMPKSVEKAIAANISSFAIYPDHSSRKLIKALAKEHKIKEEQIVLGNGAADIIYRLCLSQKPQKALIMAPSFSEYEEALNLVNKTIDYHSLDENLELDISIVSKIEGMDMVFLCNPNNPTGLLVREDILSKLEQKVKNTNTLLIIDECFLDFSEKGKSLIPKIKENPNIVIIKAFTKFYALAGIRLGYLLSSNKKLNDDMAKYAPPWNISAVAQLAGLEALKDEKYKEVTKEYVKNQRDYLIKELKNLNLKVYEGQGNYLLFYSEDKNLKDKLLKENLLIRDCSNYKNLSKGYYRIAVRNSEDNRKLIEALGNLRDEKA